MLCSGEEEEEEEEEEGCIVSKSPMTVWEG